MNREDAIQFLTDTGISPEHIMELVEALSNSEKPNKWIPVESALPEEGEEVLVWYRYWRYGEHNNWYYTYGIGYQYNDNWSVIDGGIRTTVFAWMPLPEPYKASPTGEEDK